MRRLCAMLGALALAMSFADAHKSTLQPQSSEPRDGSDATIMSLLQQSHDLAQQLAVPMRTNLLMRQAQMVSQSRPDLAREWANELLTLSAQIKGAQRAYLQNSAMRVLVRVDPDRALEMLHGLSVEEPDGGTQTTLKLQLAQQVFQVLVERDGTGALPVLEQEAALMGAQGNYPYAALGYAAMQATSKDWGRDKQRAIQVLESVFEPAFARYSQSVHELADDLEFGKMLQVLAGGLPFESVQPALHTLVKNLLVIDTRKYHLETTVYTSDGESAKADNAIDAAILFFGTLINRDPELAQQLESTRPGLGTALEYAKFGRQQSMSFGGRPRNPSPPDPSEEIRMDALRLSHVNAEVAIAKAEQLPDGENRASTVLQVARDIAGDHPERAAELIAETQSRSKITDEEIQLDLISARAFVATGQNNKDELRRLLQRGFETANHIVLEQERTGRKDYPRGLGPLVQIGIRNDSELTIAFIEGLPPSYLRANLLLGAASALRIPSLPLHSQEGPQKPNQ